MNTIQRVLRDQLERGNNGGDERCTGYSNRKRERERDAIYERNRENGLREKGQID